MQVWSLGWEDPLEKDMATHCHILAWRIPRTEEPDGVQSMGSQRVGHDWSNLAYKRRDTYESVLKRGVNLDPIIQSELSQKEKDKCHTLMYIYRWNLERWYWWTSLPGSSGDADVEAGFMDTELEQEGRRNWGVGGWGQGPCWVTWESANPAGCGPSCPKHQPRLLEGQPAMLGQACWPRSQ